MANLVSDLISETKRLLAGTNAIPLNQVNTTLSSTDTTLELSWPLNSITAGAYLSIEEEVVYVWEVNTTGKTARIQRGMLGTTAAEHVADTLVEVGTVFSNYNIRQTLKAEIASWPSELFRVNRTTVTASSTYRSQGLRLLVNEPIQFILDIRHAPDDATGSVSGSQNWPRVQWFELLAESPSELGGETSIILNESVPSGKVHIVYATAFDTSIFNSGTHLIGSVGLSPTLLDIPAYGAAWRLTQSKESERSQVTAQGLPRMAEEVPPMYPLRESQFYRETRDLRIAEEVRRLRDRYPTRHT